MKTESQWDQQIQSAVECLKEGKIIAYPTEAVFGLGCDPRNQQSVLTLLSLKKRSVTKGLILIAADWQQVIEFINPEAQPLIETVKKIGEKPMTWVFPASTSVPSWIQGNHSGVALRVSNHPVVKQLCSIFNYPIVSTSANLEGAKPALNPHEVESFFKHQICCIINAPIGHLTQPTEIREALSGKGLRKG